jgi:excisionase family DNA binding protein
MDMYGNSTFSMLTPDCAVKYTGEKWQRMLHMHWALLQHYEQKEIERMEAPSTLHEQIRAARKEAGLTQAELAEKLGVSLRTIESWEAGVRQPRYKHGNIIERILSFKTGELQPCEITPTIFNQKEAATYLGIAQLTMLSLINKKEIPAQRIDACEWVITKTALDKWLGAWQIMNFIEKYLRGEVEFDAIRDHTEPWLETTDDKNPGLTTEEFAKWCVGTNLEHMLSQKKIAAVWQDAMQKYKSDVLCTLKHPTLTDEDRQHHEPYIAILDFVMILKDMHDLKNTSLTEIPTLWRYMSWNHTNPSQD